MSFAGPSKALSVHLTKPAFYPGEALEGEVHLQFPAILDDKFKEIHIKLYGSINVTITQKTDKFTNTKTGHSAELAKDKKLIWTRGSYPPPDSHTLKIPFQFALPEPLLPTCKHRTKDNTNKQEIVGEVAYHLEIIGARGALHSARRERTTFKVLPPSARGTQLQDKLTPTWTGDWRTVSRYVNIPVGNGRTSHVQMHFVLPAIEAIPSSVYIPFTLSITSCSPRIRWGDTSEFEFIEPPMKPLDVDFRLERVLRIQPQGLRTPVATATNTILRLGGMGPGQVVQNGGPVAVETSERIWMPELYDPNQGSWMQETKFSSRFRLVCPTTLISEVMRVEVKKTDLSHDYETIVVTEHGVYF
ncbi:hypothetical protein BDY19DRAFT_953089 [Irpex rosettiformis]|uniref:Uncharacterized protein n=1 Tax=Irpex rosettiformis TaxID=378272 RepID=A0ACB8U0L3_9APHY|nr:hypothetical protein BDY19DRAFT_953089 [Irpex rosettiformis]